MVSDGHATAKHTSGWPERHHPVSIVWVIT